MEAQLGGDGLGHKLGKSAVVIESRNKSMEKGNRTDQTYITALPDLPSFGTVQLDDVEDPLLDLQKIKERVK